MKIYILTARNNYNGMCFTEEYYTEEQAKKAQEELKTLGLISVIHTEYINIEPNYTEELKYA